MAMIWVTRTLRTQDLGPRASFITNCCLFSEVNWDWQPPAGKRLEHEGDLPKMNMEGIFY